VIKKFLLVISFTLLFCSSSIFAQSALCAGEATKKLTRLDFSLDHASCPTCILKVRKALRATAGVTACDISLRKPYGGVIIFEASKTDPGKLESVAHGADPNKKVTFGQKTEEQIDAVPTLLIPKINALSQPKTAATN